MPRQPRWAQHPTKGDCHLRRLCQPRALPPSPRRRRPGASAWAAARCWAPCRCGRVGRTPTDRPSASRTAKSMPSNDVPPREAPPSAPACLVLVPPHPPHQHAPQILVADLPQIHPFERLVLLPRIVRQLVLPSGRVVRCDLGGPPAAWRGASTGGWEGGAGGGLAGARQAGRQGLHGRGGSDTEQQPLSAQPSILVPLCSASHLPLASIAPRCAQPTAPPAHAAWVPLGPRAAAAAGTLPLLLPRQPRQQPLRRLRSPPPLPPPLPLPSPAAPTSAAPAPPPAWRSPLAAPAAAAGQRQLGQAPAPRQMRQQCSASCRRRAKRSG